MLCTFPETELHSLGTETETLRFSGRRGNGSHCEDGNASPQRGVPSSRVLTKRNIEWPARSPDLNAYDFTLLGYPKSKVYEKKPRTTVDLKQNTRDEVAAISPNMLQRVMQNFQKCLRKCVDNKGHHLTDTIFRK